LNWILDIRIDKPFRSQLKQAWIRRAAEATLASEEVEFQAELSLLITDDDIVQELNRRYRGIDQTTDVLAFAFRDDLESSSFPPPADGVTHLGEVIISYPQAMRQAEEQGHPLKDELAILVIHGVLHLLEYDHEHAEQEQEMRAKEAKILANSRYI
jgi:probable rRNA maturation factor